ncbi:MAG: hypothetical protein ABIA04_05850 [Pseudomonadota bacterium]
MHRYTICLMLLFFNLFIFSSSQGQEIAKSFRSQLIDKKLMLNLYKTDSKSFYELDTISKVSELKKLKKGLVRINEVSDNNLPVFFIIQGLDFLDGEELLPIIEEQIKYKFGLFLFTYSAHAPTPFNTDRLAYSLKFLAMRYPKKEIILIGYSAGGVLALKAIEKLKYKSKKFNIHESIFDRISVNTVASPINGFEMPVLGYISAPLSGFTTCDIASGLIVTRGNIQNCHHWVTTNCSLDIAACLWQDIYPQLPGLTKENNYNSEWLDMPCGNENVTYVYDRGHPELVEYAFISILKEKII